MLLFGFHVHSLIWKISRQSAVIVINFWIKPDTEDETNANYKQNRLENRNCSIVRRGHCYQVRNQLLAHLLISMFSHFLSLTSILELNCTHRQRNNTGGWPEAKNWQQKANCSVKERIRPKRTEVVLNQSISSLVKELLRQNYASELSTTDEKSTKELSYRAIVSNSPPTPAAYGCIVYPSVKPQPTPGGNSSSLLAPCPDSERSCLVNNK